METRMKRSCSFLFKDGAGRAQGIIIQHRGQLYLLTCHHVIPSRRKSFGWKVDIEESNIILDEGIVTKGISCCGEEGILRQSEHFKKHCPFDLDFMLLELKNIDLPPAEFVDVKLSIKALELMEQANGLSGFFQDGNASCFYMRLKNREDQSQVSKVVKKEHYFVFPPLPTGSPKIRVLRDWSFLIPYFKVVKDDDSDVCGGGSSGAPMYATHKSNQPVLIGMHTNHHDDDGEVDDDNEVDDDGEVIINDKVPVIPDEFQLTKSFNTSFIWVLHLINLHVYFGEDSWFHGDFPLTEIAMNKSLLWAVFLRYQKKTFMLKKKSLLVKIAEEIYRDLVRSHSQPQLEREEKEMFDKVKRFLNYEDPAESLVIGIGGSSIEPLPPSTTTGYGTDTNINNPDSDDNPPEEVHVASKDELV
ncbi:PREDICTED: uncharacterized protein LOC109583289 [Amphimedon queenslandica]|uniref:Serine protease n=1 Tax=Amphimedon queenslandica TaxID=400682 RepID=A0A1X7UHJ1_AMPQE|nr:PREDICTED: uncharacterized protein LOC109583289 [Amphimedon queenslandica]|eukprot:XP_019854119.1 PREDICTED: uncharacterized protein LOC109583289 [Amphimedon queenslandica]